MSSRSTEKEGDSLSAAIVFLHKIADRPMLVRSGLHFWYARLAAGISTFRLANRRMTFAYAPANN
jgi:hypothetical protein